MYRVSLTYSCKFNKNANLSVIVKTTPFVEGLKKDALSGMNIFETEISMYQTTLAEIQRLLISAGDKREFAPR